MLSNLLKEGNARNAPPGREKKVGPPVKLTNTSIANARNAPPGREKKKKKKRPTNTSIPTKSILIKNSKKINI